MTAVEWLISQYIKDGLLNKEVYEQALEMERKQQIDFATEFAKEYIGFDSISTDPNDPGPAERYYNQKHK
jgi:nucleosome binding factor SPN SPT16 subunit